MTPREKCNSKIEVNLEIFLLAWIKHSNFTCTTEKPDLNPQQAQCIKKTSVFVWSEVQTSRD